jgi:dienelactone hydrolase
MFMNVSSNPYRVLLKRGAFVDSYRGGREIPYKVYYPIEHGLDKMPVILWSHGFGGSRDGAAFISRAIAAQGYIVVHITHRGTDSSLWEGKGGHPWDVLRNIELTNAMLINRIYDVPFVLDRLEEWARDGHEIGQYMDLSRVGMSGHSLGAITTQALVGMMMPDDDDNLMDLREDRISCGIAYSPVPMIYLSDAPPEALYGSIDTPLLHMTGTEDDSPLDKRIDYKARFVVKDYAGNKEQYLQVLDGGDHMIYNGTRGKLARNPRRDEHEALILEAVFAFWQAYLRGDEGALAWLHKHCV